MSSLGEAVHLWPCVLKYESCSECQISCTSDVGKMCRILAVLLSISSRQLSVVGRLENHRNCRIFQRA